MGNCCRKKKKEEKRGSPQQRQPVTQLQLHQTVQQQQQHHQPVQQQQLQPVQQQPVHQQEEREHRVSEVTNTQCQGASTGTITVGKNLYNIFPPAQPEPKAGNEQEPQPQQPRQKIVIKSSAARTIAGVRVRDSYVANVDNPKSGADFLRFVLQKSKNDGGARGGRDDGAAGGDGQRAFSGPAVPAGADLVIIADKPGSMALVEGERNMVYTVEEHEKGKHVQEKSPPTAEQPF